ncbi:MAG TPA: RNA-binding cell elongation regulator Jag/EloR [Acidimicrobiales bacterium]|nr:RNA-binding cell elongation regulator Jag/EloR [Acidimicrobiales bacterium]
MEWVEVTGRTVEEAKELALDRLGVDERDAEFEVIEEPRAGFFGRLKGEARVRARVKPALRGKPDSGGGRNRRRGRQRTGAGSETESGGGAPVAAATKVKPRSAPRASTARVDDAAADGSEIDSDAGSDSGGEAATVVGGSRRRGGRGRGGRPAGRSGDIDEVNRKEGNPVTLETQVRITEEFAKGLVHAFGYEAETTAETAEDQESAEVRIEGGELGLLIGPKGRTLAAINEISRAVVLRQLDAAPEGRVHVDISGYRQRRREALERFARSVAEEVVSSGRAKALEPMSAADRKVVHDAVGEIDGVQTSSEGEEPSRRVVISPAS